MKALLQPRLSTSPSPQEGGRGPGGEGVAPRSLLAWLLALPLLALLASCDDKIDLRLNTTEAYLVLDGTLDDQLATRDTVRLSNSVGYLDQGKLPVVSGASILLTGTDGIRDTLTELKPGFYLAPPSFVGVVGQTYRLDIATPDGERYQASATMPRHQELDSITQEDRKDQPPFRDGPYVGLWYHENPGKGDNTKFEVVLNDTLQNLPRELFAFNDDLADGTFVHGTVINRRPYHVGDTVTVSVLSITTDALNFYNELQVQINNGGLFSQPPANVRTNVYNLDDKSKKRATGYLFVQARSTRGIRIR